MVGDLGGVVIALTLDESGIPADADGRVEIAKRIIATAESYGINKILDKNIKGIVSAIGGYVETDDIEGLKEYYKNELTSKKQAESDNAAYTKLVDTIIEASNYEIADELVEEEVHGNIHNIESRLTAQGLTLDNYLGMLNMTYEDLQAFGRLQGFKLDSFSSNLKTFINGYFESRVYLQTDSNKGFLLLISLFLFIIIPVVFALFVWLFTRKRGMTNFKSYLNIVSIIQFYLAILFFIIGWFVNILEVSLIIVLGLLMMLWYYIFVIYQITNRIEKENNEYNESQSKKEEETKKPEKPEFKKIDDNISIIG